jgi:hypothetical protein
VTTMFDRYFGIPQSVIRSGTWAQMKPTEQSLYICLLHESERYRTRELRRTDAQLCQISGLSSRSFCNARKKLQEHALFLCKRSAGNVYIYTLCNPKTGLPWPGDPKQSVAYTKRSDQSAAASEKGPISSGEHSVRAASGGLARQNGSLVPATKTEAKVCGVPLSFSS